MPMGLFRANLKNVTVQIPSVTEKNKKKARNHENLGLSMAEDMGLEPTGLLRLT